MKELCKDQDLEIQTADKAMQQLFWTQWTIKRRQAFYGLIVHIGIYPDILLGR